MGTLYALPFAFFPATPALPCLFRCVLHVYGPAVHFFRIVARRDVAFMNVSVLAQPSWPGVAWGLVLMPWW